MKREIKFRYWNNVSKVMVNKPEMPYKKGWTIEQLFSERGWVWMQFTGLLDKSGREIYEGDIVRSTHVENDFRKGLLEDFIIKNHPPIMGVERQMDGLWGELFKQGMNIKEMDFLTNGLTKERMGILMSPLVWGGRPELEVIGNIYENPELLK